MCILVWPAGPATPASPMAWKDVQIFDAVTGLALVTVLGLEICVGNAQGWTPYVPVTVRITALAGDDGKILGHGQPIVWEDAGTGDPVPKKGEYLYLVAEMRVGAATTEE